MTLSEEGKLVLFLILLFSSAWTYHNIQEFLVEQNRKKFKLLVSTSIMTWAWFNLHRLN